MTIIDSGASQRLSAGAGRSQDWVWPDPMQTVLTSSSNNRCRNRLNNLTANFATGGYGGGAVTVQVGSDATLGCPTNTLGAGGSDGVGQICRFDGAVGPTIFQMQVKGHGVPVGYYNDLAVNRISAQISYSAYAAGGSAIDSGLQLSVGGALLTGGAAAGFGFFRPAQNTITVRIYQTGGGAASTTTVTNPATFNDLLLHSYEIITTSATRTAEATVSFLIDGIVVRQESYGAGSILPTLGGSTALCFTALLANGSKNVNMKAMNFRVVSGPTLADCA